VGGGTTTLTLGSHLTVNQTGSAKFTIAPGNGGTTNLINAGTINANGGSLTIPAGEVIFSSRSNPVTGTYWGASSAGSPCSMIASPSFFAAFATSSSD
jgi:hypothetical protein